MNRHITAVALAATLLVAVSVACGLELVTMDRAAAIATNWVSLISYHEGGWGEYSDAFVSEVTEYSPDGRLLGYCCHVEPKGYVVVSLYEGLAPVKAYSATCDLDPSIGGSIADVLKIKIEYALEMIEARLGPLGEVPADDLRALAEIHYAEAWSFFDRDPARFRAAIESEEALRNYEAGNHLLTSSWTQGPPYDIYCPTPEEVDDDDCTRDHCAVGCVALAGAMLMHYWCWPPNYNWNSMPTRINSSSPGDQIDAVARLCSDIGEAVGMDYCSGEGCASGVHTYYMLGVYRDYLYSTRGTTIDRDDYSQKGWFDEIKCQLNQNRPIQYSTAGHSFVADGWKVGGGVRLYHLNMGWNGGRPAKSCWEPYDGINTNTWYAVDCIPCNDPDFEYILIELYPFTAVNGVVSGAYPRDSDFRHTYIDVDAFGDRAAFLPNHHIQFVRGVSVNCTGDNGIVFQGRADWGPVTMFTKAEMSKGVRIDNGIIVLYRNGGLKLY
jgi:hypothetical protein